MNDLPPLLNNFIGIFLSIYDQLESYQLFNNSGIDYILIPILFVATFFFGYIIKYVILNRVKNAIPERAVAITEPVLDKTKKLINFSTMFIVALFVSTQHLTLSTGLQLFFNIVIFGALILAIFRFLSGMINIIADYRDSISEDNDQHILSFMKLIAKVAVASLLGLWYLDLLNFDISTFVAGIGIAGITVAFALQNVAADLFAAMAIYLDKPFVIGDYININNRVGQIEKIGLRSTHIRSIDGPLVVISNQQLTQAEIVNYKNMEERRITQTIGVSADTPVKKLRKLPNQIREAISMIEEVRIDDVWLKELGDFSWNFEIIYFVEDPDIKLYRKVEQEINFQVLELLEDLEIEIPYPIQEMIISQKESEDFINPLTKFEPRINN